MSGGLHGVGAAVVNALSEWMDVTIWRDGTEHFIRFEHVWPLVARHFAMATAEPQQIDLVQFMADKAPLWDAIVSRHGLPPTRFEDAANWTYANYAFSCDWDIMSSTLKARRYGFHDCVDSHAMFACHLDRLGEEELIPKAQLRAA